MADEYNVGDIVWAKIGKFPFWPSIVCNDPDTKICTKGTPGEKKTFSLHVRFCNDNGRRSWVKIVEKYSGKDDLLSKYPNSLSLMKNSKKQMNTWNLAVKEADSWLKFDREERWLQFSNANKIKSPPTTPPKSIPSTSATTSNNLPNSTLTTKKNTNSPKSVPDCYIYLKNLSVGGHEEKEGSNKRKIVKKSIGKIKKESSLNNFSFACPQQDYCVEDDEPVIPAHPKRKVLERLRCDVEKLEAEGIRKIREWKASKLAKATRT